MTILLRKCPSCGRRFEVHRTGEVVERGEMELVSVEEPQRSMSVEMPRNNVSVGALPDEGLSVLPPEVDTVVAERDVIQERFVCKHCGYAWEEAREVLRKEGGGEVKGRVVDEGAP
jgi:hypothetical protein